MGKQMVRVAMNTSNFLGQTGLCKSSIAQFRMCCIALLSASGNPSVQKVPIPQASALRLKSIFQKCAACIHWMQNTRGLGTAQQAFWIWFLEIRFKNCKLVPACTACYNCVGSERFTASELYRRPNLSYNWDVQRERCPAWATTLGIANCSPPSPLQRSIDAGWVIGR